MSLITRQQLLQAQSDREDFLHRMAVGEDSQRLRELLAGTTKRIDKLQKQIDAEIKKFNEKKAAEAPKPEAKPRRPLLEDLTVYCCDCTLPFPFTGKEQVIFKRNNWKQPVRCPGCRDEKKKSRPTGKNIACGDCAKTFFFSDAKKNEFEERGWPEPKFCFECRASRKAEYAKKNTEPENKDLGPQ